MDARRLRMDPFALAFGGLLVLTASFLLSRNSGAVVMCGFIARGLLLARAAGFSNRSLVPLTVGLIVVLWVAWVHPFSSTERTSAFAHLARRGLARVGARRILPGPKSSGPEWAFTTMLLVGGLALLWEFAEFFADLILDHKPDRPASATPSGTSCSVVSARAWGLGSAWWLAHAGTNEYKADPGFQVRRRSHLRARVARGCSKAYLILGTCNPKLR